MRVKETLNRTLILVLVATIVMSIAGTIISVNRVNQLIPLITGFATTTTGMVNVTLANVNSIAISDSQINFGSCAPSGSSGCNVTSNSSVADCGCTNGIWPDNITVRNDGNTNINVSVKTNVIASTLIGGADPYGPLFMFSVRNSSNTPGCFNVTGSSVPSGFDGAKGMQWDWANLTVANTEYLACQNLTPTANAQSFYLFAKIFIPADAPQKTGANATLTLTATNW